MKHLWLFLQSIFLIVQKQKMQLDRCCPVLISAHFPNNSAFISHWKQVYQPIFCHQLNPPEDQVWSSFLTLQCVLRAMSYSNPHSLLRGSCCPVPWALPGFMWMISLNAFCPILTPASEIHSVRNILVTCQYSPFWDSLSVPALLHIKLQFMADLSGLFHSKQHQCIRVALDISSMLRFQTSSAWSVMLSIPINSWSQLYCFLTF